MNQIRENGMNNIHKMALVTGLLLMSQTILAATEVTLKTSQGDIQIELFEKEAPISSQNFVKYAKSDFYKNTIFHRVIPGFMIQAGGYNTKMQEKPTNAPIKNEANNGLKNTRGTIAMARTQIVDSATSQFFINLVDNSSLDNGYAVFGKVVKGMNVVDNIAKAETGNKGFHQNVPIKPIIITDVKVTVTK